jgi:hypothetical protein
VLAKINSVGELIGGSDFVVRLRYLVSIANTGAYLDTNVVSNSFVLLQRVTTAVNFIVRGVASQTGDLQQWQTSAAAVLTAITAAGTINFQSGNTSATANTGAVALPALAVGFITMQVAGTTVKVPYYAN